MGCHSTLQKNCWLSKVAYLSCDDPCLAQSYRLYTEDAQRAEIAVGKILYAVAYLSNNKFCYNTTKALFFAQLDLSLQFEASNVTACIDWVATNNITI